MDKIKNKKKILSLGILAYIAIYTIIYFCFLLEHCLKYAETITAANLIIVSFLSIMLLGYHEDKMTHLKGKVLKLVITQVLIYFAILYSLGLVFGFLRNSYSLEPLSIINNILAPIFIVITSEILRYSLISNNKEKDSDNKLMIFLIVFALIIIDIMPKINLNSFSSNIRIFEIVTTIILPSIAKNISLTYLTYNVGYRSPIFYRLILDLYVYLVPLFPDLSDYFTSMLGIMLPFLVYLYSARVIKEYNSETKQEAEKVVQEKKGFFKIADAIFIAFTIILIALVSCKFSYFLIGIASGSMEPKIHVGDAVFVHRIKSDDDVKLGDIIVYDVDGLHIVHRVISKVKTGNTTVYHTKGDANNTEDGVELTLEDIEGKVIMTIPYIGKPSVWLSDILNKE